LVIKNREYHKRAVRAAIRAELARRGSDALYRAVPDAAFYRPTQRPDPRVKPAPAPLRSNGSVGPEQLRLSFPLSEEQLLDDFLRTFGDDDAESK